MNLILGILRTMQDYQKRGYQVLYEDVYELKRLEQKDQSFDRTIRTTLSRMKKNGLLNNKDRQWSITADGEELLNSRNNDIRRFFPIHKLDQKYTKNLIVIFDIPEKKRRYRDWLRSELIGFGFDQIQKSVWFGPILPKAFIEYLDEAKILKHIRFFKASEKDLI